MTHRTSSVLCVFALSLVGAALGVGCGKKQDPNTPASVNTSWGYGPGGGTAPTTPATGPANTMPAGTAPAGTMPAGTMPPGNTTAPGTAPAPTPTPTPAPTLAQTVDASALQPLLAPLAQQHAKGAKPEGGTLGGMLQQGQSMQASAQLAPGGAKCYTAIAVGAPSVTEIQVELWLNMPPLPPTILSQAQTPANPAVMAGSPNCYKNIAPLPAMVNLKVTAKTGSGPVLAQLYAK